MITCRICNSTNINTFKVINGYRLLKCGKCRVIFLAELENFLSSINLYDKNYFDDYLYETEINIENVKATVNYYLNYIRYFFGNVTSVLDIGAGFGLFVKAFNELGIHSTGIEISSYSVKIAKEKFGIELFNGDLDNFHSSIKFDLISFYHSFEHMSEPTRIIKRVNDLLSENGILWLSLPNVKSLDRILNGERWNGWSLPFHLYHYSPRSIKYLLSKEGYKTIRIQKSFLNPIKLIRKNRDKNDLRLSVKSFTPFKEFLRIPSTLIFSGQNMNVFAKK